MLVAAERNFILECRGNEAKEGLISVAMARWIDFRSTASNFEAHNGLAARLYMISHSVREQSQLAVHSTFSFRAILSAYMSAVFLSHA